nr:MAG TPA: hypothetical protein [Caudoviricetes sp.]
MESPSPLNIEVVVVKDGLILFGNIPNFLPILSIVLCAWLPKFPKTCSN